MNSFTKCIQSFCSAGYSAVTNVRNALYDNKIIPSYESGLPVISVGNLTAGGNGKTPLCIFLAQKFKERGWQPVVLSRGYGGSIKGPYRIEASDLPSKVGDEPLLIERRAGVPMVISRSRAAGAKYISENRIGNLIILDDGAQHRRLARDVDIIAADLGSEEAIQSFIKGEVLPLGRFRENRDQALKRVNVFIACERQASSQSFLPVDSRILEILPSNLKVFRCFFEINAPTHIKHNAVLNEAQVVAFSGIASPAGFHRSLLSAGFSLVATKDFPDHHSFSETDLRSLGDTYKNLPLVCTEKDAIKLERLPEELLSRVYVLKISAKVIPTDAFMVHIERLLRAQTEPQESLTPKPLSAEYGGA